MTQPNSTAQPPPIKVTGGTLYIDGVEIKASQDDGWLRIVVKADESIIGYAVNVNGRDL